MPWPVFHNHCVPSLWKQNNWVSCRCQCQYKYVIAFNNHTNPTRKGHPWGFLFLKIQYTVCLTVQPKLPCLLTYDAGPARDLAGDALAMSMCGLRPCVAAQPCLLIKWCGHRYLIALLWMLWSIKMPKLFKKFTGALLDFANPKAPLSGSRIRDIFPYLGHARAHDNGSLARRS